jgi:hypothetical protein
MDKSGYGSTRENEKMRKKMTSGARASVGVEVNMSFPLGVNIVISIY